MHRAHKRLPPGMWSLLLLLPGAGSALLPQGKHHRHSKKEELLSGIKDPCNADAGLRSRNH